MKFKEIFYFLGMKPNFKFASSRKIKVGAWRGVDVFFYHWEIPKFKPYKLINNEVDELASFLSPGDMAVDIGAHVGDSTLPIALAVGRKGAVFAFEPNPVVYQVLSMNAFLNTSLTNIIPVPFASTDHDAQMIFGYSTEYLANGGDKSELGVKGGHAFRISVNGKNPIDILVDRTHGDLSKIRYIKIDVEGYDYYVLKQFENFVNDFKPYIKFEIAKFTTKDKREALWRYFESKPYELRLVDESGKLFGSIVEKKDFFQQRTCDIFCAPMN